MYRRKVHCRHCGETGHNVNGCAQRKEYIKNNPNSWAAQREKDRLENAKHRKCSYCSEEGHNRKTCVKVMSDMVSVADANTKFRRAFVNMCKDKGLGVGTLVKFKTFTGYEKGEYKTWNDALALLTKINFDSVVVPSNYGSCEPFQFQFCNIQDYNGNVMQTHQPSLPNWFVAGLKENPKKSRWDNHSEDMFEVVGPGYFMLDDEEKWIRNSKVINDIVANYSDHHRLQHALDNQKLPI